MTKFVVSFVVAGRSTSISEMDLLGKESTVPFFDIRADLGGKR